MSEDRYQLRDRDGKPQAHSDLKDCIRYAYPEVDMKKFLLVFPIVFVSLWFLFGAGGASATNVALDMGGTAKFGESCLKAQDCIAGFGFLCAGNTCVQCVSDSQCAPGQDCDDGVCVVSGGNTSGQLCASNSQCLSKSCNGNTSTCRSGGSGSTTTTNKSGEGNPLGNFPGENLSAQDVTRILIGLACWLSRVAVTLSVIFVFLAGFKFMASGGDPKKYQSAKDNFRTVLLGILVIFGVYVIIATVAYAVGITDFSFIPLVC